ncbi:MAG: hybrid sensor histidine kinase/response regulator, partial [Pseudomonadota bacterium]
DLSAELEQLGLPNTELFARAEDAMDFLRTENPVLAFLDINLGHGRTSEVVATELAARGVRVVFATGYGDQISMPPHLENLPVLTKPISQSALSDCLMRIFA